MFIIPNESSIMFVLTASAALINQSLRTLDLSSRQYESNNHNMIPSAANHDQEYRA
jgi:hypothetical protein